MKVLVGERRSGLTTEVCRWVMGGGLIEDRWWSRMIFSPYSKFVISALDGIAVGWDDTNIGNMVLNRMPEIVRRYPPLGTPFEIRYAVDDFDIWYPKYGADCYERLGRPTIIAIHGDGKILDPRSSKDG